MKHLSCPEMSPEIDRCRQHDDVGLPHRVEHLCEIVVEHASVEFLLTGVTGLAAPVYEGVQGECLRFRSQQFGASQEMLRDPRAVTP
ncbi:MAG: hypothetical protein MZV70_28195 [Desulfobacterales bacterium]|nr:hypothetical protein [Desulfobacterales bacterium]